MAETTDRQRSDLQAGQSAGQGDFCPLPGAEFSDATGQSRSAEVSQEVKQQASAVGEELQKHAREGKQMAVDMFHDINRRLQEVLAGQKDQAAGKIGDLAAALRQAAGKLHEQEDHRVASYAQSAAGRLEQLSHSLREQNLGDMAGRFEDFARRRPEFILGAALLGGLLLGRVLRNPGPRSRGRMRHHEQHEMQEPDVSVMGE